MIDQKTGQVRFPGWSESLSRDTMREILLRSSLIQDATVQVKNEPHCSWRLKPALWEDGKWWTVFVYFEGERLCQVVLAASEHETDPGWAAWSEESERQKAEYYLDVLGTLLGNARQFPWGGVDAIYDEKSGSSSIIIQYRMIYTIQVQADRNTLDVDG